MDCSNLAEVSPAEFLARTALELNHVVLDPCQGNHVEVADSEERRLLR